MELDEANVKLHEHIKLRGELSVTHTRHRDERRNFKTCFQNHTVEDISTSSLKADSPRPLPLEAGRLETTQRTMLPTIAAQTKAAITAPVITWSKNRSP